MISLAEAPLGAEARQENGLSELLGQPFSYPLKMGSVQQRKDPPDLMISDISTSITSNPRLRRF